MTQHPHDEQPGGDRSEPLMSVANAEPAGGPAPHTISDATSHATSGVPTDPSSGVPTDSTMDSLTNASPDVIVGEPSALPDPAPAASRPPRPGPSWDHPGVAGAMAELDDLDGRPLAEHADAFARAHGGLQTALSEIDDA